MSTIKKANVWLALCALAMGELVYAAPKVAVNFKNNTADDALYVRDNSRNDVATYLNASPKPGKVVAGGSSSLQLAQTGLRQSPMPPFDIRQGSNPANLRPAI